MFGSTSGCRRTQGVPPYLPCRGGTTDGPSRWGQMTLTVTRQEAEWTAASILPLLLTRTYPANNPLSYVPPSASSKASTNRRGNPNQRLFISISPPLINLSSRTPVCQTRFVTTQASQPPFKQKRVLSPNKIPSPSHPFETMSAPQSDAFKKAVVDSKKLTAKPSNDELLEIYGTILSTRPPCPTLPLSSVFRPANTPEYLPNELTQQQQLSTRSAPARTSRLPLPPACLI